MFGRDDPVPPPHSHFFFLGLGWGHVPSRAPVATLLRTIFRYCVVFRNCMTLSCSKSGFCAIGKNQKYQLVHVMSACVIFGLVVVSSSKAIEDSRLRPGRTNVF